MSIGRLLTVLSVTCLWSYAQSAPPRPADPKEQRSTDARKSREAVTPPPTQPRLSILDMLSTGDLPPASTPDIKSGSSTVRIPATQQWVDTGLDVVPGMLVDVNATGEAVLDGDIRVRPEGTAVRLPVQAPLPLPSGRLGAVIVKVKYPNGADSNILAIGRGMQFRVEDEEFGRLYIGINTDSVKNNSGQFTANLRWR